MLETIINSIVTKEHFPKKIENVSGKTAWYPEKTIASRMLIVNMQLHRRIKNLFRLFSIIY